MVESREDARRRRPVPAPSGTPEVEGDVDSTRSAFLADISHELRTPLTLVIAPLEELLGDAELPNGARRTLTLVLRNARRMTRIVDAMLDFSRMESGRISPVLAELDVAALVRSLAESFQPVVRQAGLTLVTRLPDLPRPALLDHDVVERMVLNLLANAVKYTAEGTITVELADHDQRFTITVSDTGPGIRPEDQERVFRRFERVAAPEGARSQEGVGIGLPMVRQLALLLGGTVTLHSIPGTGSSFVLDLPYQATVEVNGSGLAVSRRDRTSFLTEIESWPGMGSFSAEPHDEVSLRRPRLLIVEDSPDMARFLASTLSDTYQVDVASNGQEALERVTINRPQAVLSDVMMPTMDGLGLVAALRADPEWANIPVILLSAHAAVEDTAEGLDQGADDYLAKPFSVSELRSRLAANIERAQARSADAAWRRAIVASLQEALMIIDPSGVVLELNERFVRLLGWEASEGPFRPPYPWWPDPETDPQEYDRVIRAFDDLLDDRPVNGEFLLRRRDGAPVWVSCWAAMVSRPDSGSAIIATLRDITRERVARRRRAAAVSIVAEMGSATELEQVLTTAVTGFAVLFNGEPTLRVVAATLDTIVRADGPVPPEELPAHVLHALTQEDDDGDSRPGEPVPGILLAAASTPDVACRTWIQFRSPRPVPGDELIVGDLLAQALDLAVDRIVAAQSYADRQAHLQRAIESHRLIGQAIGVLVERHRILPNEGFERLRTASQARNLKLRDIAARVLETGLDPEVA
ncbi:ATP-binding protein [Raineyella fluvialis]|nr:ATP-binding protein [Raineyella fluvialis]